ncbi:hypothetical protein KCU65_g291, partial [Aureobasidium melanogenum]
MVPAGLEATLRDLNLSGSVGSWEAKIVREAKIGLVQVDREASIGLVQIDRQARVRLVRIDRWRNSSNQLGKHSSDDDGLHDVFKEFVVLRGDEAEYSLVESVHQKANRPVAFCCYVDLLRHLGCRRARGPWIGSL